MLTAGGACGVEPTGLSRHNGMTTLPHNESRSVWQPNATRAYTLAHVHEGSEVPTTLDESSVRPAGGLSLATEPRVRNPRSESRPTAGERWRPLPLSGHLHRGSSPGWRYAAQPRRNRHRVGPAPFPLTGTGRAM